MCSLNKIKGVFLIVLGLAFGALVYGFDALMGRPVIFGTKSVIGFLLVLIMIVNGARIFRRE